MKTEYKQYTNNNSSIAPAPLWIYLIIIALVYAVFFGLNTGLNKYKEVKNNFFELIEEEKIQEQERLDALEQRSRDISDKRLAESLIRRGWEAFNDDNLVEAERLFFKAVELDKNQVGALNDLGRTMNKFKRYEKAIYYYEKVLEVDPNYIESVYNIGNSYIFLGKTKEATFWFERAIQIDPSWPHSYIRLGDIAIRSGEREAGLILIKKGLELGAPADREFTLRLNSLNITMDEVIGVTTGSTDSSQ